MALSKEEQIQLTELAAKAKGMTPEKYIENMAKEYGIEPAEAPTSAKTRRQERGDPNTRFIEKLLESGEKGDLSMDAMFDKLMKFSMMKMMAGGGMFGSAESKKSDLSAAEIIAANDEKWDRRRAQEKADEKADRREEAIQKQLDDMKLLIQNTSGSKKDELTEKFDKLTEKLDAEKEKRHEEAIAAKGAEIAQLREDMAGYFDELRNQPPAKGADEGFFEMMQNMEKFDDIVRSRGKALGMSDEQIDREISGTKPVWQQILADITGEKGILAKYVDVIGKKNAPQTEQPGIAEGPAAQVTCAGCGQPSDNSTKICSACQEIALAETERLRAQEQATKPEPVKEEPVTVQVEEPALEGAPKTPE